MAPLGNIEGYRCAECGLEQIPALPMTCTHCDGRLDIIYDISSIRNTWSREALAADNNPSIWRWLPLLPVANAPEHQSLRVGGTPLVNLDHLAEQFGLNQLAVKDDTRNPSASLKDRASEVAIQHAREHGFDTLVAASTGNAAASLACLSAWHGSNAVIIAPASAPPAKLAQILQFGATLIPIDGNYDQAFDLSLELAESTGLYCRSTAVNPVLGEGKKTVALEIAEQCGWNVPDIVFVPVGDGCIIGGVHKGFRDLFELGWIERVPKLVAVQADGSCAVVNAIERGGELTPVQSDTLADSIAVDLPRDGFKAVRAVQQSNGFAIRVSDDAILRAQHNLARSTGIFAEPAAAAAWAGPLSAFETGQLDGCRSAVVLITGSGLKNIAAASRLVQTPEPVAPNIAAIQRVLAGGRR